MFGNSYTRFSAARAYPLPVLLFLTLVTAVLLMTVGCSPSDEEFGSSEEYVAQGRTSYQRGDLDKALRMYDKALELDQNSARTFLDRSVIYLQKPETYDDAIADASRAIELDASLARAYVNRASALIDMGHSEYAQLAIRSKVISQPASAWMLPPEERVKRAIEDATRAIELDPNLANAYFARAHAHMDIGRSDLAVEDFSRALDTEPELYVKVMSYTHRSQAYRNLGNSEMAIRDANRAMELHPNLAENFKPDSRLVTWHGFGPDAIQATTYTNLGLAYHQQGRPDLSIEEYSLALEQDSDYIEAYVNRSNAYRSVHLFEEALEDANRAIESKRHLALAYNARALAHLGLGDADNALSDVTEAIGHDGSYAMAYSNRAYIYTSHNQYDLAIADATKAIELEPNLAEAYANRAEANLMKGDYEEVIADSTAALSRDPTLTGTRIGRALAYLSKAAYSQALTDADQTLVRDPGHFHALYVRGVALLALTDGKDGRDDLNRVIQVSRNQGLINLAKRALEQAGQ